MIRFVLIQNRGGRTRLSKWFMHYDTAQKLRLQSEIHRIMVSRGDRQTNFIEFHNFKIIYRRYGSLFVVLCIDVNDNQLLHYELIHLLLEMLEQYFHNVCELDILFSFNKVYGILDEILVGGEIMETAIDNALQSVKLLDVDE